MRLSLRALIIGVAPLCFIEHAAGQKFNNIQAAVFNDSIVIHYDVTGATDKSSIYTRVYCSHDAFAKPLTGVSGDLYKVRNGENHRIVWRPSNQLDDFSGELSFRLAGNLVYDLNFISLPEKIKRIKGAPIRWVGGRATDSVTLELLSPENILVWRKQTINSGSAILVPSRKTRSSKGYQLVAISPYERIATNVRIARRTPRFWILFPFIVGGGAAYYFLGSEEPSLPTPPDLPN